MRKTKRESTSSPNIAIQKLPLWKFFGRGVGRPFFQKKGSPQKMPRKNATQKAPQKKEAKASFLLVV